VAEDDWDPFDDDSGDLLPAEPVPNAIEALTPVSQPSGEMELVTGVLVIENGIPSELLRSRAPQAFGRLSPVDAQRLGLSSQGMVRVVKNGEEIRVAVTVDQAMTPGRIFIPLGIPSCPVNKIGTGVVEVARLEEVHSA
jgi:hypothetical protein